MRDEHLWKLFWETGHPAVWLAIRRLGRQEEKQAAPAFRAVRDKPI